MLLRGRRRHDPRRRFLCVELGALLRYDAWTAAGRIADALNVRDRHPHLWAAPSEGRIRARQAVRIATDCAFAGLSKDAASWVDTQVAVALLGG